MFRYRRTIIILFVPLFALLIAVIRPGTFKTNSREVFQDNGNAVTSGNSGYPGPGETARNPAMAEHGAYPSADDISERPVDDDSVRRLDIQKYADYFGVSFEEASYRLQMQDALGGLQSELAERERDTFAGFWIQNVPEYRFVVMFTRDGETIIEPYLEGKPYAHLVATREARVTLVELHNARDAFLPGLENIGVPFDHSINVENNRVEIYVLDTDAFLDALNERDIVLPSHVAVLRIDSLSR
jgi:hypothetical protein